MPRNTSGSIALIRAVFGIRSETRQVPWAPGYFVNVDGEVFSTRWWRGQPKAIVRKLKVVRSARGYSVVSLRIDNKTVVTKVYLIVLKTFVGPVPDGCEGCHNNNDKMDSKLSNLRWDTRTANSADRLLHGTDCNGEKNGRAVINREAVEEIRNTSKIRGMQIVLARKFGVSRETIRRAANGENWKTV